MSTTTAATALTTVAAGIASSLARVSGLKVYGYEPRDLDELPAATVGAQTVERTAPDEIESELGSLDWRVTTKVMVYLRCDDPETAYTDVRSLLPVVIREIERDRGVASGALDQTVVRSDVGFTDPNEQGRQMAVMELDVEALLLVADY